MKKFICLIASLLTLMLCFSGCGEKASAVQVQRADALALAAQAELRYPGMVVSENVVKISRDMSKTVQELLVEEGQEVHAGDVLFSYDSEALRLDLEKQNLELEKMKHELSNCESQMKELQAQLNRTGNESDKLQLTLQINSLETQQLETTYQIAAKEKEIAQLQSMVENVDVTSPVDGSIRKIDEQGTEGDGTYITIQQSGAYKIKGTLNELSMMNGINVGAEVMITSRVDPAQTWHGYVSGLDMENAESGSGSDGFYYGGYIDPMTSTTKYPFYVELDSTDGLLLGQHVYIQLAAAGTTDGLWVPDYYLTDGVMDEFGYQMTQAAVFVANGQGRLEKRTVTLGAYNEQSGAYEILEGLSGEDYVADPTMPGCEVGAAVTYLNAADMTGTVNY